VPPSLKFEDAGAMADIREVKAVALLQNAFGVDVSFGGRSDSPAIFGVSANWQELRSEGVADGRFINADDIAGHARVAVLGTGVAALLFPDEAAIGKSVRIGDVPFQVIGTLPSRGAGPAGASLDDLIAIPVTTAATRLFNRDFLTMAIAQLARPEDADIAEQRIRALLRERHHLASTALDDFTLTNPTAMMKNVTQMKSTLAVLLRGVAALAAGIGSLVILGLMLASVTQRQGAIGVARAVGATRAAILCQFALEAGWTALFGGLLGGGLGTGIALASIRLQGLPWVLDLSGLLQSVLLAVGLGLLGGLYPAWRAARVDPVLALRS
jgi:ABC-type antimicrobial peptide transport system permease subunit